MAQNQEAVIEKTMLITDYPPTYFIRINNDDFTTMDFVVKMLREVFFKSEMQAFEIMMSIHQEGYKILGPYSYDIACSKKQKAITMARAEGFPLRLEVVEYGE